MKIDVASHNPYHPSATFIFIFLGAYPMKGGKSKLIDEVVIEIVFLGCFVSFLTAS